MECITKWLQTAIVRPLPETDLSALPGKTKGETQADARSATVGDSRASDGGMGHPRSQAVSTTAAGQRTRWTTRALYRQ